MKVIEPRPVTDSVLLSCNVPETDASAWDAGTPYTQGQQVISGHILYEALTSTTGDNPKDNPDKWLSLGATNRWKMWDKKVGTRTVNPDSIIAKVKYNNQIVQSVALLECDAISATVTITDSVEGVVYSQTKPFAGTITESTWWHYFFEPIKRRTTLFFNNLPSYLGAEIEVKIEHNPGRDAECGVMIFGAYHEFADAVRMGASIKINDYSRKRADDFGYYEIVERPSSKKASWDVVIPRNRMDVFFETLDSLRATPSIYIGGTKEDLTTIYGFPIDFGVVIDYPKYVHCNVELEGLT